jgi:hypothetical protein
MKHQDGEEPPHRSLLSRIDVASGLNDATQGGEPLGRNSDIAEIWHGTSWKGLGLERQTHGRDPLECRAACREERPRKSRP